MPRATGGPPWATVLAAVLSGAIALALRTHIAALTTLFTASTIMPALLYAGTVLLYVSTARRRGVGESHGATPRPFGKFETSDRGRSGDLAGLRADHLDRAE